MADNFNERHSDTLIKEELRNVLTNLYHVTSERDTSPKGLPVVEFFDSAIGGVVGVDYSNKKEPFSYYFPDKDSTPHTVEPHSMIETLRVLNNAQPRTMPDLMNSFLAIKDYLLQSSELREKGVSLLAHFKNAGSVEVFQIRKEEDMVVRVPKNLITLAFDPVAEAVEYGRLNKQLEDTGISVCVPYAMGIYQLMPLFKGLSEKVKLNFASSFHGFELATFVEKIGGVIIDPLEESKWSPKLSTTRKILQEALK